MTGDRTRMTDRSVPLRAVRTAPVLPLWAALISAAAAGGLLTLAFPAISLWFAAFPAVGLLLLSLIGRRAWSALLVGLVVSLLQAVTQIHEQTLAVVPKIAAVICTVVVLGPFMLTTLNDFARLVFDRLVAVGGS